MSLLSVSLLLLIVLTTGSTFSTVSLGVKPPGAKPSSVDQHHESNQLLEHFKIHVDNTHSKKDVKENMKSENSLVKRALHAHTEDEQSGDLRQTYIKAITELRGRLRELHNDLLHQRQHKDRAMHAFSKSLDKRNDIATKTQHISKERRILEKDLLNVRDRLSEHESSLHELTDRARRARNAIKALEDNRRDVLKQNKYISDDFQNHGLTNWVNSSLGSSQVNSLIRGAFVQGAVNFVEPVLDGFDRLADVNNQVSNTMSNELNRKLSLSDRPFYAGFVTNLVLLAPIILTVSAILRIKRSFTRMTIGHLIILTNGYFALLSLGSFAATTITSVDVLSNLGQSQNWINLLLAIVHGILFVALFIAHLTVAVRTHRKSAYVHAVMLFVVGTNFMLHSSWSSSDGVSHANNISYAFYTVIFGLVLYHFATRQSELESLLNNPMNMPDHRPGAANDIYIPIEKPTTFTINDEKIGLRDTFGLQDAFAQREEAPSRMLFRSDQKINMGRSMRSEAGNSSQVFHDAELIVVNLDRVETVIKDEQDSVSMKNL